VVKNDWLKRKIDSLDDKTLKTPAHDEMVLWLLNKDILVISLIEFNDIPLGGFNCDLHCVLPEHQSLLCPHLISSNTFELNMGW